MPFSKVPPRPTAGTATPPGPPAAPLSTKSEAFVIIMWNEMESTVDILIDSVIAAFVDVAIVVHKDV